MKLIFFPRRVLERERYWHIKPNHEHHSKKNRFRRHHQLEKNIDLYAVGLNPKYDPSSHVYMGNPSSYSNPSTSPFSSGSSGTITDQGWGVGGSFSYTHPSGYGFGGYGSTSSSGSHSYGGRIYGTF